MDVKEPQSDLKHDELWLFKENIRLAAKEKALNERMAQFEKEQEEFKSGMKEWHERIQFEKKRLEEESHFFDKKFRILEQGFKQLAADKDKFDAQKRASAYRQKFYTQSEEPAVTEGESFFFCGVRSQAALKKRYRELTKIFHPDNMGGDNEVMNQINKEYEQKKKNFEQNKRTV